MVTVQDILERPDIVETMSPAFLAQLEQLSAHARRGGNAKAVDYLDAFRVQVQPTGEVQVLLPRNDQARARLAFQRVAGRLADYDLTKGLE